MAMKDNMQDNLERDLENAIRARGLRESMQQWEAEKTQKKQRIIPLWGKVLSRVAVAAVLLGVIVTVVPPKTLNYGKRWVYQQYAHYFKHQPQYQNSSEVLLALASPSIDQIESRAQSSHALGTEDPLWEAIRLMNEGDYRSAQTMMDAAASLLDESSAHYQTTIEDIEYLHALCDLGRGRRAQAKRQLQSIAAHSGIHQHDATELLKHFK